MTDRVIRLLYLAHRALTIRMFDGRGMRPWHAAALWCVRLALDHMPPPPAKEK